MISIEFFGSPGSGKTTIRNFLAKEFEKMSIKTLDNKKLILYGFITNSKNNFLKRLIFFFLFHQLNFMDNSLVTKFILKNIMYFKKKEINNFFLKEFKNFNRQYNSFVHSFSKKIELNKGIDSRMKFVKRWIYNEGIAFKLSKAHNKKNFILINSEGFFQRAIRYFYADFKKNEGKINPGLLSNFLNKTPKSDYLIYVNTSIVNSKKRIKGKKISVIEKEEMLKNIDSMSKISSILFRKLHKKNSKKLKINGDKDLNENISYLIKFFKKELATKN